MQNKTSSGNFFLNFKVDEDEVIIHKKKQAPHAHFPIKNECKILYCSSSHASTIIKISLDGICLCLARCVQKLGK